MSSVPSSFADLCERSAARFLQSALVVDDRASYQPTEEAPRRIEGIRRPPQTDGEEGEDVPAENAPPTNADEQDETPPGAPLNAKILVDEFARLGIVCGVMRPEPPGYLDLAVTLSAARRCDIVVVDWHLDDEGERALELLQRLIADADQSLRLIAIYTRDAALSTITETLAERFGGTRENDFTVVVGPVRLAAYGKSDSLGAEPDRQLSETGLPAELLKEFARHAHGLVPAATLFALGGLRAQMHPILAELNAELDAGYLGHRMLLADPEEAEDQLVELIVSVLRTVIDNDPDVRNAGAQAAIELWLHDAEKERRLGELDAEILAHGLRAGLGDFKAFQEFTRITAVQRARPPKFKHGKPDSHTFRFLADDPERGARADALFAERLSQVQVPHERKTLTLGTIVRDGDGLYWICVQPVCDSIRLNEVTRFPFLPLTEAKDFHYDYVVPQEGGHLRLCLASGSMNDLRFVAFVPDGTRRVVLARDGVFESQDDGAFGWTAQLSPAHAHRLAQWFGGGVSRVGLDESEIVRRARRSG